MKAIVIVWLVAVAAPARAEDRCTGWAAGGALAGMMLASSSTVGVMKLAGSDPNSKQHEVRNDVLFASTIFIGGTAGSIGACAAFSHERHVIPAATFVLAGGAVGGLAGFEAFRRGFSPPPTRAGCTGDCGGDSYGILMSIAVVGGMAMGGIGGYLLHRSVFGVREKITYVVPVASHELSGLAIVGRF